MLRQPPSIDAWGGGGFRVNGQWHEGSLLILDDAVHPWSGKRLTELTEADFAGVFAAGREAVEFILLGTGLTQGLPSRELRDLIRARGLGLEYMSTEAATRTYNVLATEGRRVAAALIAV